jgi:hypothetical protein
MVRFAFRALVFITAAFVFFTNQEKLASLVLDPFFDGFGVKQFIWVVLMLGMIRHLLPLKRLTMGVRKIRADTYGVPVESYSMEELYKYVQDMNIKAWKVMLVWLCFNAIFATLYLVDFIGEAEMILLSFFYYLSDLICVLFFCPFQTYIMKNSCCVNCRIFDWGHFMIYTPLLFIKSFYSWSLFFTACVVLIRWEFVYANHPERFWKGSNASIRCQNCSDKMCQIKEPLN